MTYGNRYIGPNLQRSFINPERFTTPEAADERRKRFFSPENWEVVSLEMKEVATKLVPQTTTTTVWVAAE